MKEIRNDNGKLIGYNMMHEGSEETLIQAMAEEVIKEVIKENLERTLYRLCRK